MVLLMLKLFLQRDCPKLTTLLLMELVVMMMVFDDVVGDCSVLGISSSSICHL